MTDAERYRLLYGPYAAPRWRYGRVVMDEVRGEVTVVGMTAARIPWPVGKRGRAKAPVVAAGLARALRAEAAQAVAHWWGMATATVSAYRRALDVPRSTSGTRRLFQQNYRAAITPEVHARAIRAANTSEANARKGWRRGMPLPAASMNIPAVADLAADRPSDGSASVKGELSPRRQRALHRAAVMSTARADSVGVSDRRAQRFAACRPMSM